MLETIQQMIQKLYMPQTLEGYTEAQIAYLKQRFGQLPEVLEQYYRTAGGTQACYAVQDIWILPEHYQTWKWLQEIEDIILLHENQGVCSAGVRKADLALSDPPVFVREDGDWLPCAPSVSTFLCAALAYESVFALPYTSEEFYWLEEEDIAVLPSRLTKLPFALQNWLCAEITLYQDTPEQMVAVMQNEDGSGCMIYGAASEAAYDQLYQILEDIGESM